MPKLVWSKNEIIKTPKFLSYRASYYLYKKRIAFLMAWHPRLGKDSLISKFANKDIARLICKQYLTLNTQYCPPTYNRKGRITKNMYSEALVLDQSNRYNKYMVGIVDEALIFKTIYLQSTKLILLKNSNVFQNNSIFTLVAHQYIPETNDHFFKSLYKIQHSTSCELSSVDCSSIALLEEGYTTNRGGHINIVIPFIDIKNGRIKIFDSTKTQLNITDHSDYIKLFTKDTIIRGIFYVDSITKKDFWGKGIVIIKPKTIQILAQTEPDFFSKFEFIEEGCYILEKYENHKTYQRHIIKHPLPLTKILDEGKCHKCEFICVQTPLLPLTFDIYNQFTIGEDSPKFSINLSFNNMNDVNQVKLYNTLNSIYTYMDDRYINMTSIIKEKIGFDPYFKAGILNDKTLIFNENGKICKYDKLDDKLKRDTLVKAIFEVNVESILSYATRGYIQIALKQLQFFPEPDLTVYAFIDEIE